MFLPNRNTQSEDAERRKHFQRIEELCMEKMATDIRTNCILSVQEVQCGDPNCAPIDTLITLTFKSGPQGMCGIPAEARDVTQELIQQHFPPAEILEKWNRGEEAEWPPAPEPPELRFAVGTAVLCRIGPQEWSKGKIIQLWYREANWPEGAYAPYQIKLQDGREIFAPQDMDQVVRLDPDAPSSQQMNE